MSDSIKKWHEMQGDKSLKIFESPDRGETVTERPFGGDTSQRKVILSEGVKKIAYSILIKYPAAAIQEAARILKSGE